MALVQSRFVSGKTSVILIAGTLALVGCANSHSPAIPLVSTIETTPAGKTLSSAPLEADSFSQALLPMSSASRAPTQPGSSEVETINVQVTLNKTALAQDYFYGADLQYSSSYDSDLDLYNQSTALGHVPVYFRISGDQLQLISDEKIHFPSEVNHPEQLISTFKILSQTADTVTVAQADSGVYLGQLYAGTGDADTNGELIAPSGPPPRNEWIRSFEFDAKDNIILQQSILTFADGTRGEFMESIFPRSALTPGSKFEKFAMDPNDPVGGTDGAVTRYRFLPSEKIFDGETELAYGQHFDISPDASGKFKTINWYVTPNIPDEDLQAVKDAVEGWNRYFRDMKGINQDIVLFKGRLPDGIHIGDPRFNVINWDSRLIAGAAYETQASDPHTGLQSHSLIYMPAAWLQIGTDYWTNGRYSDPRQKSESVSAHALHGHGFAQSGRLACVRDVTAAAALLNSGRIAAGEVSNFGTELLKQTLFHEVGHALGFAHNFKGSLAYEPKNPKTLFSSSIMDYNDYEIERGAFYHLVGSDGPKLEYDRQTISAIYNHSQDVSAKDPHVPTCNDDEADTETSGVDPLCIRYDIQHDPTESIQTALSRINSVQLQGDLSLAQAIANAEATALDPKTIAAVVDKTTLDAATDKVNGAILGAMKYYYTAGKASLSKTVRLNLKSLYQFEDDVLPDGYDELAMRERTYSGVLKSVNAFDVSPAVSSAIDKAIDSAIEALSHSPAAKSAGGKAALEEVRENMSNLVTAFKQSDSGLPALRIAVLKTLSRHKDVPFFFGTLGSTKLDYETAIVHLLAEVAGDKGVHGTDERVAAATALYTYQGRLNADATIAALTTKLNLEVKAATDNDEREDAISILNALKAQASDSGDDS